MYDKDFYSFFIFYIRSAEDRWLLPTALPICCLAAVGIICLYKFIKKHNKYFAIAIILLILIAGAYNQITFANNTITNKQTSYLQIRQGFEWIKANTPADSVIIGSGIQPYAPYYADRRFLDFPENSSGKETINQADYLVMHGFTSQSGYFGEYLEQNQDKWAPIHVFFFDPQKTQPAFVIYQKMF